MGCGASSTPADGAKASVAKAPHVQSCADTGASHTPLGFPGLPAKASESTACDVRCSSSAGSTDASHTHLGPSGLEAKDGHAITGNPLKHADEATRAIFLQQEWEPFTALLNSVREQVSERKLRGFAPHEVLPSHTQLSELVQQNLELTRRWHGRPNAGLVYDLLMDVAAHDGHCTYCFADIPHAWSEDKYIRVIDGKARRRLYSAPASRETTAVLSAGLLPQVAGESAIDNLVLPSIRTRKQMLLLKVGHRVQQFFLRVVQRRQRKLLLQLGFQLQEERFPVEEQVKAKASDLVVEQAVSSPNMSAASVALEMLVETGRMVKSYGQLPEDVLRNVDRLVCDHLDARIPEVNLTDELKDFLQHCEKHPGRNYQGSGVQHKLMLFKVMASPHLRLLWRSDLERFTQHRYIVLPWRRQVQLLALEEPQEGQTADSADEGREPAGAADEPESTARAVVVLREAGTSELTRYRRNVFPYGDGHGLGQSGGGCAERPAWNAGTLMYEWGTLLCEDEHAKVPNHWVTDIEKIISDCLMLNPDGGLTNSLPGEALHEVGQNPVVASSIGLTQHTQVTKSSADEFPVLAERCCPQWHDDLRAWVDIVQVGSHEDAFFVTFRTQTPDYLPLLQLLVALRSRLLGKYGRTIDFNVSCQPTSDGEFIIIFTPVACIQRIQVPSGTGILCLDFNFQNPDLDTLVTDERLPVALVDCSHGKGNFLAANEEFWAMSLEGRPLLSRLYDFNRKPGARLATSSILQELLVRTSTP